MSGTLLCAGTCISFSNVPLSQSSTTVSGHDRAPNSEETAHVAWISPCPLHSCGGVPPGATWGCVCDRIFTSHGISNVVGSAELQGIRIGLT
jgi:hypothetical protein